MRVPPAIQEFLQQERIAVAGVSRSEPNFPGNLISQKLRDTGHTVFMVNPSADEIQGKKCFRSLGSIGGPVDALVITAPARAAEGLVHECARLGIRRVWMHRSFGAGSLSRAAAEFCRANGITVIEGACPMMFCEPVDVPHKCARWLLRITGSLKM